MYLRPLQSQKRLNTITKSLIGDALICVGSSKTGTYKAFYAFSTPHMGSKIKKPTLIIPYRCWFIKKTDTNISASFSNKLALSCRIKVLKKVTFRDRAKPNTPLFSLPQSQLHLVLSAYVSVEHSVPSS